MILKIHIEYIILYYIKNSKSPNNDLLGKSSISTFKQLGSSVFDNSISGSVEIICNEVLSNYKLILITASFYSNGAATYSSVLYSPRFPLSEYYMFLFRTIDGIAVASISYAYNTKIVINYGAGTLGNHFCVFGI